MLSLTEEEPSTWSHWRFTWCERKIVMGGRCSKKVDWGEIVKGLHKPTMYLDFVLWETGTVHRFLSGGVRKSWKLKIVYNPTPLQIEKVTLKRD